MAESKTAQMMRLAREFHATNEEGGESGKVGRPPGKRSNPNYERLTVLVEKQTRKMAARLWEDIEPDRDMSELVQKLLAEFIVTNRQEIGKMEDRYRA